MWLAVNFGGTGFGIGSGGGSGQGTGHGAGVKDATGKDHKDATEKDKEAKPPETSVSITVLGGERVKEQKFYVIGRDEPRNRKELEQAILDKKQKDSALKAVEILLYTDSVPKDSEAVTDLEEWAKKVGLTPKVVMVEKKLP
jgi:hypothetical protein